MDLEQFKVSVGLFFSSSPFTITEYDIIEIYSKYINFTVLQIICSFVFFFAPITEENNFFYVFTYFRGGRFHFLLPEIGQDKSHEVKVVRHKWFPQKKPQKEMELSSLN